MIIEGIRDFSALRNFIYSKMRGYRDASKAPSPGRAEEGGHRQSETELLAEILEELRGARAAVETLVKTGGRPGGEGA